MIRNFFLLISFPVKFQGCKVRFQTRDFFCFIRRLWALLLGLLILACNCNQSWIIKKKQQWFKMIASCNYKPKSTILQPTGTICFFLLTATMLSPFPLLTQHWTPSTCCSTPLQGIRAGILQGAVVSRMSPVTGILPMYMGFVISSPKNLSYKECLLLKETSGSQLNWLKNFYYCLLNWQLENWFSVNNSNFYYCVSNSLKRIQISHLITWIYSFCLCVISWICIMRFESMSRGKEPLK